MAESWERMAGFVDPETARVLTAGPIVEVGLRDGHLYFVVQQHPNLEGRVMDLHAWITEQVQRAERLLSENEWPWSQAEGVRRRCESDRRILAIHCPVSDGYTVACDGCGTAGICDDYVTENVNDCPILLAIAHAHGLTPEILAALDRPQPPKREPVEPSILGKAIANVWGDALLNSLRTATVVPPALRGPNWEEGPQ